MFSYKNMYKCFQWSFHASLFPEGVDSEVTPTFSLSAHVVQRKGNSLKILSIPLIRVPISEPNHLPEMPPQIPLHFSSFDLGILVRHEYWLLKSQYPTECFLWRCQVCHSTVSLKMAFQPNPRIVHFLVVLEFNFLFESWTFYLALD